MKRGFPGSSSESRQASRPKTLKSDAHQVCQLNASVYELCSPPGEPSMEVLFFHGFQRGDYKDAHLATWKCGDGSSIWPQTWLVEKFPDARILSVSYDARINESCEGGRIDMHLISENLTSDLLTANIGQKPCRPVVLVGHSFGGLVIKHICVDASSETGRLKRNSERNFQLTAFLENVKGIFFYSTPHQGVLPHIAKHFVAEGPLLEYVETLSTPKARNNFDFDKLCGHDGQYSMWQITGLGESSRTKSGSFSDVVVEEASARYGTSFNIVTSADHITVCRPMEKNSRSFSALKNFLEDVAADSKAKVYGLPNYPTALQGRVFEVQQKLANTPIVGIVGRGGIGKTTIAKELFNKISPQFEYTCFVDNVKGIRVHELNVWVLDHLLRNGTRVKPNSLKWSDLQKTKTLITMDDVDSENQVKILPRLDEFGSGSRLVFTTRDRGVLKPFPNCAIYEVDFLKPDEGKKLFCQNAFEQEGIPDNLTKLNRDLEENVKEVVKKCSGLPLTLEVMGCYLRYHQSDARVWKETLHKLGKAQSVDGLRNDRVWSSLRVSYDALSPEEQEMFIEAGTYFFQEPVETAVAAWSTAFGSSESRWKNLLRTSMVKEVDRTELSARHDRVIKYKQVWVHEHLRDLANHLSNGATISTFRGKSYRAVDLLNPNAVQAQTSILHLQNIPSQVPELQVQLLDNSEKLKYLKVRDIFEEGFKEGSSNTLSRELILLQCTNRDNSCLLPISLEDVNNLAVLKLECWQMRKKSFEALGKLGNLRILSLHSILGPSRLPDNFGHLYRLERLELEEVRWTALPPSFGNLPALNHLRLSSMRGLVQLPESFGKLSSLATLVIEHCAWLASLPESFGNLPSLSTLVIQECARLASLPESFGHLSSLTTLEIVRCESLRHRQRTEWRQYDLHEDLPSLTSLSVRECPNLERLPASFELLPSLQELQLGCAKLKTLPERIGEFKALTSLKIERAENLEALPDSFGHSTTLRSLHLSGDLLAFQELHYQRCTNVQRLPDNFGRLTALEELSISGAEKLEALPDNFGNLVSLRSLSLNSCQSLERLPESFGRLRALEELSISGAFELEALPDGFGNLVSLRSLSLDFCRSLKRLPESFGQLRALEELSISRAFELEALPESFGRLRALEELSISMARKLEALPDDFGNLVSLRSLSLNCCPSLERLPKSFGLLSALQKLELDWCTQLQTLPHNFGQLSALKTLTIILASHQKRLLRLPEEVCNLRSLEHLRLEHWDGLETLPESLGRMSSLRTIILTGCSELKSLPDSLGKTFVPDGDRSTEARRPAAECGCQMASIQGCKLFVRECPLLSDSVLQGELGWNFVCEDDSEDAESWVYASGIFDDYRFGDPLEIFYGGRWYHRNCPGEDSASSSHSAE